MRAFRAAVFLGALVSSAPGGSALAEPPPELGKGLSVSETLRILSSAGRGESKVTLTVRGGGSAEGSLKHCDEKMGSCLVMHPDGTTSVVSIGDIAAVKIVEPASAKAALRGNKIYREEEDEVLTLLAFKRMVAELGDGAPVKIAAGFSSEELGSEDCRYYAGKVLDALRAEVKASLSDSMGKAAFAGKGNAIKVTVKKGVPLSVRDSADGLELEFDCFAPLDAEYRAMISQRLSELL